MLEQLRALVKLAEIDNAATSLRRELEELPAGVREMAGDIEKLEALLQNERTELAEAEELQVSYRRELERSGEMLSRAKSKGAQARNAREADAADREMKAVRETIREREEELDKLVKAIEQKRATLAGREEKLREFRDLFSADSEKADTRIRELNQKIEEVTAGRAAMLEEVPKVLARRYERIRSKHPNPVVPVVDGTCQGCRMQIPQQQYNEMHRGDDIHQCPHCLRFLFLPSVLGMDATPIEAETSGETTDG